MSLLGRGPLGEAPLAAEIIAPVTFSQTVSATLTTTVTKIKAVTRKIALVTLTTTASVKRSVGHIVPLITISLTATIVKSVGHIVSTGLRLSVLATDRTPAIWGGSSISGGHFSRGKWRKLKKTIEDEEDEDDVEALLTAWMS